MVESLLRIVVVEDEAFQRRQILSWLVEAKGFVVADVAADGREAIAVIDRAAPDLVLLDVALPEVDGLAVLAKIRVKPDVIFTTAFRDYAIEAFELGAVDYLLKPFNRPRLLEALERARRRRASGEGTPESVQRRVASVLDPVVPLDRIFVRDRDEVVALPLADIIRLESDGDYTAVHTAGRRFLLALPLKAVHARTPQAKFLRVHRQHLVHVKFIERILPHDEDRLKVRLQTGETIVASRSGSQLLRALIRTRA